MSKMHVLSVQVNNHAGVLSRISGLFSRRMYNIDSLSVGVTENPDISVMTIVTHEDSNIVTQIINQLSKLDDVIDITKLHSDDSVLREHILIKVSARDRTGVMEVCDIFRAAIVDISNEIMMAELTGSPNKISAFIELMEKYDVKSLVRTGMTGMQRG